MRVRAHEGEPATGASTENTSGRNNGGGRHRKVGGRGRSNVTSESGRVRSITTCPWPWRTRGTLDALIGATRLRWARKSLSESLRSMGGKHLNKAGVCGHRSGKERRDTVETPENIKTMLGA